MRLGWSTGKELSVAKGKAKNKTKAMPAAYSTVVDFVRYAVTRFTEAKLAFGQGTRDAVEDAVFLVGEALGLPVDQLGPFFPARLAPSECRRLFALIERRVRTRRPAAYLLKRAYLQGLSFYVDERVIVPRSYLAELLYGKLFQGDAPLTNPGKVARVLELCTGSGCLAVMAAAIFPNAEIDAVDI
jgi:ribosomal protein L3 glutamine methyltransferase